jgi:hypothetical protein
MKLAHTEKTSCTTQTTSRPWRAALVALVWIGGGVAALFALCTFGPTLVAYAATANLHIAVLVPLVSCMIAVWDVGGLMLIMLGVRRLITVCSSRGDG